MQFDSLAGSEFVRDDDNWSFDSRQTIGCSTSQMRKHSTFEIYHVDRFLHEHFASHFSQLIGELLEVLGNCIFGDDALALNVIPNWLNQGRVAKKFEVEVKDPGCRIVTTQGDFIPHSHNLVFGFLQASIHSRNFRGDVFGFYGAKLDTSIDLREL